jgi:lysophospholipase L1-like esterase
MSRNLRLIAAVAGCGTALLTIAVPASLAAQRATTLHFLCGRGTSRGALPLGPDTVYTAERGYGFRAPLVGAPADTCASDRPFLFDVALPEGDYDVTVTLGDASRGTNVTVKAESRRLMLEQVRTRAGELATRTFTVNVRTPAIPGGDSVRLKPREVGSATWDDRLTIELNGERPALRELRIVPARHPVTIYLAGNSTVVDQAAEPWAAWGQMIPRFFRPRRVVVANHAESGETLKAFVGERRLPKVLSTMKNGDYLFIEFAHNDQKPGASHLEPFTTYKEHLRRFIAEARTRGATPVLVTSMHRRSFDSTGAIVNTLGDYPEAMRQTAAEERVPLIDLNAMSRQFYEALGPERSVKAFVHYPAGTYPGQTAELKDDTHFNNYGAYELARMVVEGIRKAVPSLARELLPGIPRFDPAHPDSVEMFALPPSPIAAVAKPAGS